MAKAGIRRSQAPNLCHAEAKIGPERDISLPRCRRLTSRRSSRTVAPKSGQSPGTVFTQPATEPDLRRGKHAVVNGSSRARWRQRRADSLLRSSLGHRKPMRLASISQRRGSPDRPRCQLNPSRHRPESEFPIDQCPWTAGSFFHDFRTPDGVRNSSRFRSVRFRARRREPRHSAHG